MMRRFHEQPVSRAVSTIGVLLAGLVASCGDAPDAPDKSEWARGENVTVPIQSPLVQEGPQQAEPFGEEQEEGAQVLVNKAYIQWCNQPPNIGPWGTVCVARAAYRAECRRTGGASIVNECEADADVVCGGKVPPARLKCSPDELP
jgi:hypothetical protein